MALKDWKKTKRTPFMRNTETIYQHKKQDEFVFIMKALRGYVVIVGDLKARKFYDNTYLTLKQATKLAREYMKNN